MCDSAASDLKGRSQWSTFLCYITTINRGAFKSMSQFMTRILLLGGAQFCTGRGRHTQRFNLSELRSILQSKYNSNPYAFPKSFFFLILNIHLIGIEIVFCALDHDLGTDFPNKRIFCIFVTAQRGSSIALRVGRLCTISDVTCWFY